MNILSRVMTTTGICLLYDHTVEVNRPLNIRVFYSSQSESTSASELGYLKLTITAALLGTNSPLAHCNINSAPPPHSSFLDTKMTVTLVCILEEVIRMIITIPCTTKQPPLRHFLCMDFPGHEEDTSDESNHSASTSIENTSKDGTSCYYFGKDCFRMHEPHGDYSLLLR